MKVGRSKHKQWTGTGERLLRRGDGAGVFLDAAACERLRSAIDGHSSSLASVASRIADIEQELQGRHVSADELAKAEREHGEQVQLLKGVAQQVPRLETQLSNLQNRLQSAIAKREQLTAVQQRQDVYSQLAGDLGTQKFQSWVPEDMFRSIVQGASLRLAQLTGRYEIEVGDSDRFFVVDNDNGGERRLAEALSGGETFLASLALVLELSEQIQQASGAVRLDSLFIDEGFGTLDAETLDT